MKIKDLCIHGRTFLAPLAGVTNLPFRLLVKKCGCAVVSSEMVSAKGFFYNSEKTLRLLSSRDEEQPLSIQLFGSDADLMANCARAVQDMKAAQIIDINFGCSVKKVIKQGAGVALMKQPALAHSVLSSIRKAMDLPLTIKIRSGWDPSGQDAFRIAKIAQDAGVDALILHPRTAGQGFKGKADWNLIKELKQTLSIPVIGNGDITCVDDAVKMLLYTGCDAVMVGRAALSNPFIFSQIDSFLETGSFQTPSHGQIFNAMAHLIHGYIDFFGEEPACRMLRGRLSWFVKGIPGCSSFRKRLSAIESGNQALSLIKEFEILTG
ncbi:MAG: tRNA dihydrouridine synthase DusB [Desulfobacterales bacterium RIFOXYA12_FULL_46_15]|nr:MAG: tRNA dihydrouridine synthase DusB [Desulfobacterales bacterium RIFOXYA12_FULL_46_15]